MNRYPASSRAFRFDADSIPASAITTRSRMPWRVLNPSITGTIVVVSALFPSNRAISSGNPSAVTSRPTVICGSTRRCFDIPTLRRESSFSASKYSVVRSYITNPTGPPAHACAQQAVAIRER